MASKRDAERKYEYGNTREVAKQRLDEQSAGSALKLPTGLKLWELGKAGRYTFDVIPYIVGKGHPKVKEGRVWWERTFWQHSGVGPENKAVCCLRKNWGEPCPCCEQVDEFVKTMDRDDKDDKKRLSFMKSKFRQALLIQDHDARKPEIELFEYSYHGFGITLDEKLDDSPESLGYDNFFHPKGGKTLQAKFAETDMGDWLKASVIEMLPRNKDLPEDILDHGICLDDMVIRLSYDQIKKLMRGEAPSRSAEDNGHDDRPARSRGRVEEDPPARETAKPKGEDRPTRQTREDKDEDVSPAAKKGIEQDTVVEFKGKRCKVVWVNRAGTILDLEEVETGKTHERIDPEDVDIPDDKPARRSREDDDDRPSRTGKGSTREPMHDKDDDDAPPDDDRPARRRGK